jgi:hypothetical protein
MRISTKNVLAFATILFSFFYFQLFGQSVKTPTEIFIIGTLHSGNRYIDHNTLYNALKEFKPDIILWEWEKDYKPVFGLRTARFLKIAKVEIEELALSKYGRKYKHEKIYGFDTVIANRKQYRNEIVVNIPQSILSKLDSCKMDYSDSFRFKAFLTKSHFYYDFIVNNTLMRINNPDIIDTSRTLFQWERDLIIPLAKKYISDTALVQKYEAGLDYWEARNDFMVRKIQSYMDANPGKRFVILTGLNHKYYLIDGLNADNNRFFVLKEFKEY